MKKPKVLNLVLLAILLFSSLDHSYAIPHEYIGVNFFHIGTILIPGKNVNSLYFIIISEKEIILSSILQYVVL